MSPQQSGPARPLDWSALTYEPLATRPSKVTLADLGRPLGPGASLAAWVEALPGPLAGRDLRALRDAIVAARRGRRPVVAAMGGHVVKTGCAPYLIDWMRRGILTGLALNGSAAIHDAELAMAGHTSEEVGPRLADGSFGFARETSDLFADACAHAAKTGEGLGAALGARVTTIGGPGLDSSLLASAHRLGVPLTVHVAVGTDIVHMSPNLDGAALGTAALADFRSLCGTIAGLDGGVWLNLGSAVVMPEVFLKAVAIARNLGHSLDGLTTANLDFNQQYRGRLNVLQRPGGAGIGLTGHHELLIPLLHAAVVAGLGPDDLSGPGGDGLAHSGHASSVPAPHRPPGTGTGTGT